MDGSNVGEVCYELSDLNLARHKWDKIKLINFRAGSFNIYGDYFNVGFGIYKPTHKFLVKGGVGSITGHDSKGRMAEAIWDDDEIKGQLVIFFNGYQQIFKCSIKTPPGEYKFEYFSIFYE